MTFADDVGLPLLNTAYPTILLSAATWTAIFLASFPISRAYSSSYRKLDAAKQADWCTRVTSTFHAVLICYLAFQMLGIDELKRDKVYGFTDYFLWDVGVSLYLFNLYGPSFLFHGVLCLMVFTFSMRPFLMYFGAPFLLFELSTPFLNINWFCDKMNITGSPLQLVNGIILMASFFGVRVVYGSYNAYDFFSTVISQRDNIAPHLIAIYGVANISLTTLNFFWFYKIVDAVRRRFVGAPAKKDASKKSKVRKEE
ncbi:hypothetical protein SmJEL517_g05779 [Synchytrium microbalum]|uniref:TLC domain-containing protein n=1 Tax=Synchytrium microbalum TaxID=1806994 RepID=A0A507BZP1_9FUNG|nr:uncharacterized protein SmJEL517_g05779 [Synchytrium microbalum]TPX30733.1 hypothetical protein SmJEL517_g05779 [Synchytrium microbalum]